MQWGVDTATVDGDALAVLALACRDNEQVRFNYRRRDGDEAHRPVEPHHLVSAGRRWYLVGWDVRRDDWLHSMGRANRGSAALVDAAGTVYAVSGRFRGLLQESGHAGDIARLPFSLPEGVLGEEGGELMENGLHLRVARCGNLYLLHARKPLPLDALSPREQEIARALSNGKTLKSIARQYGIAVSTVANHTTRIYRKLAIYRREDLIELLHMKPSTVR